MTIESDRPRPNLAGAPLRAIGTFVAIWILARIVAWNLPEHLDMDPTKLAVSEPSVNGTVEAANARYRNLEKLHLAARADRGRTVGRTGAQISGASLKSDWPYMVNSYSLPAGQYISKSGAILDLPSHEQPTGFAESAKQSPVSPESTAKNPRRSGMQGYFWVFARQGDDGTGAGRGAVGPIISNGQYGGSQAGAILSHPVWSKGGSELSVYARLTTALAPVSQEEVAVGAVATPVRNIPIRLHVEQRLDAYSAANHGQALYLSGGTGPDPIFENMTLETYGQAGYILGSNETHFFDGAATIQTQVAEISSKRISLGAGMWMGGQRGTSRLDVGPRADFRLPVAGASARVAVDWRIRIAGDARPGSGLTVTVSTGF